MNNIGNTVVYVNGRKVLNDTGLQKDIAINITTSGTANVTVVYEADGGVCSLSDDELIPGQLVIS